jgi:lipid-binding SYLF domain-containing protein
MKKTILLLLTSLMGLMGTYAWAGSAREDSAARLQSSVDVLHAIMATPDKGIPEEVLSNAKCILVVPDLIKGGFIFGGKHGRASLDSGGLGHR